MNKKLMKALADLTNLEHDGCDGDNRLHFDIEDINIFVNLMSKSDYNKMMKDLKKTIKGKGYTIYAWNDISGYDYWFNEGESGSSNYIKITAEITDLNLVCPDKLILDCYKLFNHFEKYDNAEQYYYDLSNK